jgi:hypothetical protein
MKYQVNQEIASKFYSIPFGLTPLDRGSALSQRFAAECPAFRDSGN